MTNTIFTVSQWEYIGIGSIIFAIVILFFVIIINSLQKKKLNNLEQSLEKYAELQKNIIVEQQQYLSEHYMPIFNSLSQSINEQLGMTLQQNNLAMQSFETRQHNLQKIVDNAISLLNTNVVQTKKETVQQLTQQEIRIDALRASLETNLSKLRSENEIKLEQMRQTVDEKLQNTLEKRLNSSFEQVSQRLEQVYKSLGEVHALATGVGDIKKMLSNVKTRGVWGEMQLGALIDEVLTTSQYEKNVAVIPGSRERVEYAIRLPGKEDNQTVYLPIDSKFPNEDYVRLTEALQLNDVKAIELAEKSFYNTVKTEAKRIEKYISPPNTTDFAVMFLPLESLYAQIMQNTVFVEKMQREQRILFAGPSTFMALLNSLQMGFKTLAIEQRSHDVWCLLGTVKKDFVGFAQSLKTTQDRLRQATESIEGACIKSNRIQKKLQNVEVLIPDSEENDDFLEKNREIA